MPTKQEDDMQTLETIREIVSHIKFKDWKFRIDEKNGVPFMQIIFEGKCNITGVVETQYSRKWMLSYHMVNSEVVRTAYKAAEAAMLHEVEEAFTYKGARIYNPHMDLDEMVEFAKDKNHISYRDKE
jgi:hypothetical protein